MKGFLALQTFLTLIILFSGQPLITPEDVQAAAYQQKTARLTFYTATGNPMANGEWPYEGAAACSYDIPLGTWVYLPDGMPLQCLDRGNLEITHIDAYAESYSEGKELIEQYGDWTEVWIR